MEGEEEMIIDKVVCYENDHRFRLGNNEEGYNFCPECNQLINVVPADVTKGEPFTLKHLRYVLIDKNKQKDVRKMTERKPLSISVDMDTNKMQLKLRAIAKHAEALADELESIDNPWECPNCSKNNYKDIFVGNTLEYRFCKECKHAYTGERILTEEATQVDERVKCTNLTSKQIEKIRYFIGNYDKRKMPICSCDITRVLELVEESPTHEGDG